MLISKKLDACLKISRIQIPDLLIRIHNFRSISLITGEHASATIPGAPETPARGA
jgi:hypothetical protein